MRDMHALFGMGFFEQYPFIPVTVISVAMGAGIGCIVYLICVNEILFDSTKDDNKSDDSSEDSEDE